MTAAMACKNVQLRGTALSGLWVRCQVLKNWLEIGHFNRISGMKRLIPDKVRPAADTGFPSWCMRLMYSERVKSRSMAERNSFGDVLAKAIYKYKSLKC